MTDIEKLINENYSNFENDRKEYPQQLSKQTQCIDEILKSRANGQSFDLRQKSNFRALLIKHDIMYLYTLNKSIIVCPNICLGSSESTTVLLGIWNTRQISIKFVHLVDLEKPKIDDPKISWFNKETQTIKQLKHKNLILYLTHNKLKYTAMIATNLFPFNDLELLISNIKKSVIYKENGYKLKQIRSQLTTVSHLTMIYFTNQIIDALNYIHNRKIVHRDLKPSNIFLDSNYIIGLADFQLAIPPIQIKNEIIDLKCEGTSYFCGSDFYLKSIRINHIKMLDYHQLARTIFHMQVDIKSYRDVPCLENLCQFTIHNFKGENSKLKEIIKLDYKQLKLLLNAGVFQTEMFEYLNQIEKKFIKKDENLIADIQIELAKKIKKKKKILADRLFIKTKDEYDISSAKYIADLSEVNPSSRKINGEFSNLLSDKHTANYIKHVYNSHLCPEANVKSKVHINDKRMNRKFIIELQKASII